MSDPNSLKYERFTPSGCKDVGIRQFEFVTKTQFLSENIWLVHLHLKKIYIWFYYDWLRLTDAKKVDRVSIFKARCKTF